MPFGLVSGVGRRMGGDRRRKGAVLGMNLGRPVVTNGDFATRLFPDDFGDDLFAVCWAERLVATGVCTCAVTASAVIDDIQPTTHVIT